MKKYTVLGRRNKKEGTCLLNDNDSLERLHNKIQKDIGFPIKNEFLEILNIKTFEKTGFIKPRDLIHKEGDWHGAFHLNVFSKENGETFYFMQKRKKDKDVHPNKLDVIAAGHYQIGEVTKDGLREVEEEIGLNLEFEEINYLGKRINYDYNRRSNVFNCEVQDIAFYHCNKKLEDYSIQKEELDGLIKVNLDELISLLKYKKDEIRNVEAMLIDNSGEFKKTRITISRDDIIKSEFGNYYLKTALLASMLSNDLEIPNNPYQLDITAFF